MSRVSIQRAADSALITPMIPIGHSLYEGLMSHGKKSAQRTAIQNAGKEQRINFLNYLYDKIISGEQINENEESCLNGSIDDLFSPVIFSMSQTPNNTKGEYFRGLTEQEFSKKKQEVIYEFMKKVEQEKGYTLTELCLTDLNPEILERAKLNALLGGKKYKKTMKTMKRSGGKTMKRNKKSKKTMKRGGKKYRK
jgi:hypothetical protein